MPEQASSEHERQRPREEGRDEQRYWKRVWASVRDPANLPNWLIAAFTFTLAIFAAFAWCESKIATSALISNLDLTTRSILVSDPSNWAMPLPLGAGKNPVISFEIENAGNSNALILDATYEFTVGRDAPRGINKPPTIPDFPALIGPRIKAPIVIPSLPALSAEQAKAVDDGASFLWLRARFVYRDDRATVYQVLFTGKYGKGITPQGTSGFRFTFPDAVVPQRIWDAKTFEGLRCLNVIKSEPADLGCGEKN